MRIFVPAFLVVGYLLVASVLLPRTASAQYVDPGNASLLWQLLLSGAVGIAFGFRNWLVVRLRVLLQRIKRRPSTPPLK